VIGLFEKDVMVVPRGGMVAGTIERFGSFMALEREVGEPCLIESSEDAGETPLELLARRLNGLRRS